MQNRSTARLIILSLTLVSLLLTSGCSSGPNPALNLGGIDLEEALNGQLSRVHQIMGGVNSLSAADKALPELEQVSLNMDDLVFNSSKLSEEGQTALSLLALKATPEIQALIGQVNDSPAIARKLGAPLEGILSKLKQLI